MHAHLRQLKALAGSRLHDLRRYTWRRQVSGSAGAGQQRCRHCKVATRLLCGRLGRLHRLCRLLVAGALVLRRALGLHNTSGQKFSAGRMLSARRARHLQVPLTSHRALCRRKTDDRAQNDGRRLVAADFRQPRLSEAALAASQPMQEVCGYLNTCLQQ